MQLQRKSWDPRSISEFRLLHNDGKNLAINTSRAICCENFRSIGSIHSSPLEANNNNNNKIKQTSLPLRILKPLPALQKLRIPKCINKTQTTLHNSTIKDMHNNTTLQNIIKTTLQDVTLLMCTAYPIGVCDTCRQVLC